MTVKLAFNELEQFIDGNGVPYAGALLFTYSAGSSTKLNTYKTSAGNTANTNPIVLDANGRIPYPIWLTSGSTYKFILAPSTDSDPPVSPIWSLDDISGINDISISGIDQWQAGPTPTYVSTTSFTLVGDQTSTFEVGRRVKTTNSGGTVYSTIVSSAYTTLTTVTVANDSGTLDSGLSAVSYGLITSANSSIPGKIQNNLIVSSRFNAKLAVPTNLALSAGVSSSALTVSIKGVDGNDPSDSNPVYIPFRNVTASTGDTTWLVINTSTSITVSSGSTLGTSSGVGARIWIVGFNDGGTFRLGVINCYASGVIYPLRSDIIASSTAEGGAGAADSAGVIYTGTAVSSKAMIVLGYLEAAEATAGTWATTPSKIQIWTQAMNLPGSMVQVSHASSQSASTGTTALPDDNTIPQNTEGDQYLTTSITPSSAINRLLVSSTVCGSHSANNAWTFALFQDSTANALAASRAVVASGATEERTLNYEMIAGTTSSTAFKIRAGGASGATFTFNGTGGGTYLGGTMYSYLRVQEIMI